MFMHATFIHELVCQSGGEEGTTAQLIMTREVKQRFAMKIGEWNV